MLQTHSAASSASSERTVCSERWAVRLLAGRTDDAYKRTHDATNRMNNGQ